MKLKDVFKTATDYLQIPTKSKKHIDLKGKRGCIGK